MVTLLITVITLHVVFAAMKNTNQQNILRIAALWSNVYYVAEITWSTLKVVNLPLTLIKITSKYFEQYPRSSI